ncbi:MAG: alpha/beta hydrolase [Spirochaetaceae bacterium]
MLIIIVTIIILISALGFYFSGKVINIKVRDMDVSFNKLIRSGEFTSEQFNKLNKENISIKSDYGYQLNGFYITKNKTKTDKVMVISHGVGNNIYYSVKYALLFLAEGFDVVIYDHRRHGNTLGKFSTYGYHEKHDLEKIIQYVKTSNSEATIIGIHGESMGAAIALQNAGEYNSANFYIFDCPYSDLKDQLQYRLQLEFKLNGFLIMPLVNIIIFFRTGFHFNKVSPITYVKKINKPAMFITTEGDTYIPPYMTKDLYNEKVGVKKLFVAKEGDHAEAFVKNKDEYINEIKYFLNDVI